MKQALHPHWKDRGLRKHRTSLKKPYTSGSICFYDLDGSVLAKRNYENIKDRKGKIKEWKAYFLERGKPFYYHIVPEIV